MIIQGPGQGLTADVLMTIGPVLKLSGLPGQFTLLARSPPVSYPLRLTGSSSQLDYHIQSLADWIEVTPKNGTTPADLTLTLFPAKAPSRGFGIFTIDDSNGHRLAGSVALTLTQSAAPPFPPSVGGPPMLAPGGIIHVQGSVPCADATASLPWPSELGGCSVRMNGVSLAIGATVSSTVSTVYGILPNVDVLAQLPYAPNDGTGRIDISDLNGVVHTTYGPTAATSPQLLYIPPPGLTRPWLTRADGSLSDRNNPVQEGEVASFRISSYGVTQPAAPLGDVPNSETTVRPVAHMDAFIDGRRTEVVSAELSKTEVGVAVVRIRIPEIQPDDHLLILRVGGAETFPAPLRIAPR